MHGVQCRAAFIFARLRGRWAVVPGRTKPVFVAIGLAGTGMIARTILYSVRAA